MINRPTIILLIVAAFAAITMFNQPFFAVGAVMGSPVTIIAVLISFIYSDYRTQKLREEFNRQRVPVKVKRIVDIHEETL